MQTIIFECETITPMFMYGADGRTPELRPASIKGVMRFWWRAIHGHLKLKDLKEQEGEIFGDTDKKSKLIIYPIKITNDNAYKISLTPHHKKGYCSENNQNCFFRNNQCMKAKTKTGKLYKFTLKISIKNNPYLNQEQLQNLFILTTTLGGFGQRSRRGFGSVQILKREVLSFPENIENLINNINPNFSYTHQNKERFEEYPYIQKIEVGKTYNTYQSLLKTIGKASHDYNCDELGFAKGKNRLASPIYVSVLKFDDKDYRPIITTLNNPKSKSSGKVEEFKKAIL